jgi:hypothetical protein
LKVFVAGQEKLVAQSKLQSLLAQLERGNRRLSALKIQTHVMSSSPANFSFLAGPEPSPDGRMSTMAMAIKSQSTPDMTEYDKMQCGSFGAWPEEESSSNEQVPFWPLIE